VNTKIGISIVDLVKSCLDVYNKIAKTFE